MKQLLLSITCLFAGTALFAQSLPVKQPVKINLGNTVAAQRNALPNQLTSITDTADQYITRATSGTFYGAQGGGYVFGTSYYYDSGTMSYYPITDESGLEFDGVGSATVTDLLIWVGAKYINGNADNINAKVYDVGPDSMPTTLLGTGTISMADVDTGLSAIFTSINFPSNPNITGDYFISMEYAGIDDTIGFVSTGDGDGQMEKRLRQKASTDFGGAWGRMGDLYPFLDVDMFWAPIYTTIDDGINNHFTLKTATIDPVYPSLATSEVHLDYNLTSASNVGYYMFDLKGRRYFEMKAEQQQPGAYSQTFNVNGMAAGNYFLAVIINGQMVTQKVVITK